MWLRWSQNPGLCYRYPEGLNDCHLETRHRDIRKHVARTPEACFEQSRKHTLQAPLETQCWDHREHVAGTPQTVCVDPRKYAAGSSVNYPTDVTMEVKNCEILLEEAEN